MRAPEALARARASGLVVRPRGRELGVSPRRALTEEMKAALLAEKGEILEFLRREMPDPGQLSADLRDEYEERAAIIEVYDEQPREEAERRAWWIVVSRTGRSAEDLGRKGGSA